MSHELSGLNKIVINAARERVRDLIDLQKQLLKLYGDENYNVFIFGSYPTTDYDYEKSDADVAVYTPDIDLYKKMSLQIELFFQERHVTLDLFYIDISTPAPVYLSPLHAQIRFTDYYPEELTEFEKKCAEKLQNIKEKMAG